MRNTNREFFSGILATSITLTIGLWSTVVVGADGSGNRPGDANMTCAQIATELQPYMAQMMPAMMAMGQTSQAVMARSETRMEEGAAESAAETAQSLATLSDPTGMASKILGQRQLQSQKARWKQAEAEDKPLNDTYKSQMEQVAKEGRQLQSDARLQRLMQLAQQKNCQ